MRQLSDKQRLTQAEADIQTLARYMLDIQGAKPRLSEILGRYQVTEPERRPLAPLPEQRAKVVA
jgi:hypothetical protein